MRTWNAVVVLALLGGAQAPQEPVPRFRSGVDVVLLDVTVLDRDRRPVRGLTASDFAILEDGKPQPIVSFDELDSPEPDGSLVAWMREVAPDVRTNADDDRRIVLLILDDGLNSFRQNERVKTIGRKVIDQLGPADQAAIIFTGNNSKSQEFTNDRAVLRRAVERYVDTTVGGSAPQNSIQTIKKAVQSLLAIPHRRKAMIMVSPLGVNPADPNSDRAFQLSDALRHAQRANVTIYPINPAGLEVEAEGTAAAADTGGRTLMSSVGDGRDLAGETARIVANDTGGFAVTGSNTFEKHIQQIFRETGSYYLLGFQSAHRDGKFRRVEVRTSRDGLIVRTRNGYTAANPEKDKKKAETLPLLEAIGNVVPLPDVPLRVVTAPFAGTGKRANVAIALGVQQPAPHEGAAVNERVQLMVVAVDERFRQRANFRQTVQLKLRPVDGGTDAKYEILTKVELDPGRYQLRFAAHSTLLGKSGSVFQNLEIPDFTRAPLSLSGVVLSVTPPLTSAPRDFLASITPIAPTTQRTFLKGHDASAFLQVYQGGRQAPLPVELETTIVNEQDVTVHLAREPLAPEQFGAGRPVDHHVALPLDRLAPGAYLLRFAVSAGKASANREVRFVVR